MEIKKKKRLKYFIYVRTRESKWKLARKIYATTASEACDISLGRFFAQYKKRRKKGVFRENKKIGVSCAQSNREIGDVFPAEEIDFVFLYSGW